MADVYILGVGMTPFGKHLDTSCSDLARSAARLALDDAGIDVKDIGATFYANTAQGSVEGQHGVKGQHALRPMGIEGGPFYNVENACTGSSSALNLAYLQVAAGQIDIALVVGAEKLNTTDHEKKFATFNQPADLAAAKLFVDRYWDDVADIKPPPHVQIDESKRGVFMDIYSIQARMHMKRYGTTWEQIAMASSKNHKHSVQNPLSQYRNEVSVAQALSAKVISWPLTIPMCSPISDGATAAVICSARALERLGRKNQVKLMASVMCSGTTRDIGDVENSALRRASQAAYKLAGITPSDISVAEVHDASAFAEIPHIELLGLCEIGAGGLYIESGAASFGGRTPVNLSGGLQSKGHPVAATGLAQVYELTRQLRGQAEGRTIDGARYAVASNGGGFMGVEEAMSVVTILGRA